jgi:hypothetical protein
LGFVLFAILGGMVQRWQFSSDVEHREAMGDKVLVDDFITTAPPDDQNAATYISQAIGERQLNQHEEWLIDRAIACNEAMISSALVRIAPLRAMR